MDKYVVTKEEIESYEGIEKTHLLNENAQRRNKLLGDLTGLEAMGFHKVGVRDFSGSKRKELSAFKKLS